LKTHRSDVVLAEYETRPDVTVETIQQVRVVWNSDRWGLCLVCKVQVPVEDAPGDNTAGIDLGISNYLAIPGQQLCNTASHDVYMPSISARIPEDDEDELKAVVELLGEDKSTVIRKALAEGLGSLRRRVAIERYQSGDVSVNQAARLAGVSIAEWLEIAREHNLTTQLTPEDLDDDATTAREL
jgi:predicted HTH domain antitoxin